MWTFGQGCGSSFCYWFQGQNLLENKQIAKGEDAKRRESNIKRQSDPSAHYAETSILKLA